ncbi:TniB protein [Wenxinia saemankumensis]|uniref:TniB protein n=2 Tax=Wenxinia saemankumensis TaxID=1447782 RepID=A0A1M6I3X6_9RHOB|nr:TniB protein [Wenxinia saemankumensis]
MKPVGQRYMLSDRDDELRDVLGDVLRFAPDPTRRATPIQFGRQLETRGLVVSGPSGVGKTTLLKRGLDEIDGLGLFDGSSGHVVELTVPPEATLKGLAFSLLDSLLYTGARNMTAAEAWEIAQHRLALFEISVLWIDEAHHLLTSGSGRDAKTATRRLKLLLQGNHALVVVLSGTPELVELLQKDAETWRRFLKMPLRASLSGRERLSFARYIRALCKEYEVTPPNDPHLAERLLSASNGIIGEAIDLVTLCIERARAKGLDALHLGDFRRAFVYSGNAGSITPFDEVAWEELAPALEEIMEGVA